jgi:hypothetical protein
VGHERALAGRMLTVVRFQRRHGEVGRLATPATALGLGNGTCIACRCCRRPRLPSRCLCLTRPNEARIRNGPLAARDTSTGLPDGACRCRDYSGLPPISPPNLRERGVVNEDDRHGVHQLAQTADQGIRATAARRDEGWLAADG